MDRRVRTALFCKIALVALTLRAAPSLAADAKPASTPPSVDKASETFRSFLDDEWRWAMTQSPEWATQVGFPGQNRRWTDMSPSAIEQRDQHAREALRRLVAIPRAALGGGEQLDYDLFKRRLELEIEGQKFKG